MAKKNETSAFTKTLIALGLKKFAETATEEQMATAFDSIAEEKEETPAEDSRITDTAECKPEGKDNSKSMDAKAKDARKKMHDALDRRMDAMEAEQEAQGASEAEDDEALSALIGSGAAKSKETSGLDKELSLETEEEGEGEDSEGEEEGEEAADGEMEGESPVIPGGDRPKTPVPAATDSAVEVLRMLRPVIARSKDKAVRAAYDTARKTVTGSIKTGSGNYATVAKAAATRGKAANDSLDNRQKQMQETQDAYKSLHAKR